MCKVKKSVKTTAALLSAAAVLTSAVALPGSNRPDMTASVLAAGQIANPIIWADVPDDDIIRVGDTYYMVSTTMYFSPGAPIMKSKDLANWEICNYVFDTYANGDVQNLKNGKHDYSHGQWATSLRYNEKKKKYYAFFGSYGSGKSYICSTDDIENGEWSRVELNGMYHDASMLFDDDGRNYLVYGAGGTCNIKEFNSDMTGWAQGAQERRLFKTNFNNLAGEGWHIHKIKGYYYILGIAWPSGHGRLEFCYRSKSLTGNWENKTLLDSGLGSYGSGCAQGGIVDTPDGKWYGADITWDDPVVAGKTGAVSGAENEDYLLVGSSTVTRMAPEPGFASERSATSGHLIFLASPAGWEAVSARVLRTATMSRATPIWLVASERLAVMATSRR